jgi:hypothetical protein
MSLRQSPLVKGGCSSEMLQAGHPRVVASDGRFRPLEVLCCRQVSERGRGELSRLVVFDTNAIEQRYLAPLLRGEVCRDFDRLRCSSSQYTPAFYVKSYYEICSHVKFGWSTMPLHL